MNEEKNSITNMEFSSILIIVSFVTIQMISNIASVKIGLVFSFAVDMGTFLYPFAFTIRDLAHKRFGKSLVQKLIIISAINTIFMSLFFYFVGIVKPDISWSYNDAFIAILSPVFRISFASIASGVIAELIDTEIYHLVYMKFKHKYQWVRVLASNGVSVPLDSIIFSFIAFLGSFPINVIFEIIIFNIIVKYAVTFISIPSIYLIKNDKENQ